MREFTLDPKKQSFIDRGECFFYERDFAESIKSCTPGEWAFIKLKDRKILGFINPFILDGTSVTVVDTGITDPEQFLKVQIKKTVEKRKLFGYGTGSRIIYGFEDNLPGIIADMYSEVVLVQINNAGMDRYRELIKDTLKDQLEKEIIFLDNQKYREKEGLPAFDKESLPEIMKIEECNLKYEVPSAVMQKVGYYYDHRENRLKLEGLLNRFNRDFSKGVDLFCYIGSWGMHALRSGVDHVEFVDQGNMDSVVMNNVALNDFDVKRAKFTRQDVFKFLDDSIEQGKEFDLVVCDPPAFTKNAKNKNKALAGYEKLYNKIFKLMEPNSILAAASCTQNISLEELDLAVVKTAQKNGRKVQVLDLGIQGWDHPVKTLKSKSNYIKYLCYIVE
ncbi:MAG: hypothetical protein BM556_09545 [Bacteriovorax sp. MedPE-SWde]|nr:MAG: hypothetical protein BM556_09545 [Bacteriovorax sp. MedPE-SWde]